MARCQNCEDEDEEATTPAVQEAAAVARCQNCEYEDEEYLVSAWAAFARLIARAPRAPRDSRICRVPPFLRTVIVCSFVLRGFGRGWTQ